MSYIPNRNSFTLQRVIASLLVVMLLSGGLAGVAVAHGTDHTDDEDADPNKERYKTDAVYTESESPVTAFEVIDNGDGSATVNVISNRIRLEDGDGDLITEASAPYSRTFTTNNVTIYEAEPGSSFNDTELYTAESTDWLTPTSTISTLVTAPHFLGDSTNREGDDVDVLENEYSIGEEVPIHVNAAHDSNVTYDFAKMDFSSDRGPFNYTDSVTSSDGATFTTVFREDRTKHVRVRMTDADGLTDAKVFQVEVDDAPLQSLIDSLATDSLDSIASTQVENERGNYVTFATVVNEQGQGYSGIIYGFNPGVVNSTYEVNTTYDFTREFDSQRIVAVEETTDGENFTSINPTAVELNGNVTITEATNRVTGESVTNFTEHQYYNDKLLLKNQMDKVVGSSVVVSDGGSTSIVSTIQNNIVILGGGLLVLLFLFRRED